MKWCYLPVRQGFWPRHKIFLIMLAALSLSLGLQLGPAARQARRLTGQTFFLKGRIISSQAGQAIVRQSNGTKILLLSSRELEPGWLVQGQVLGLGLQGRQNPGGFSERAWAWGQGILLKARPVQQLEQKDSWGLGASLRTARKSMQKLLQAALNSAMPHKEAALLTALLLGDKTNLSKEERFDFNQAGLGHLMAVSGLHLACLLLPVSLFLRKLKVPAPRRYLYLILFLLGWGSLLGWPASFSRAVIMTSLPLLGKIFLRTSNSYYCLALAFFLLLLLNPFLLCQFGFWLSFLATAGVLGLARPLAGKMASWLSCLPDQFCQALAVSCSAQLATLPLLLAWGKSISLLSILVNIPAGFLTSLILWLGLFFLPLALAGLALSFQLPALLVWPLARLLRLLLHLAAWLARQRAGRLFALQVGLLFFLICLGLFLWQLKRAGPRPAWLRLALILSSCLLFGLLAGRLLQPPVRVYFLAVGQGDAILIRPRWGKTILIDGGNPGRGRAVLIPALDALGICRPGLVIASHGHADHVGGLAELADYGMVRKLLLPAGLAQNLAPDDAELASLLEFLSERSGQLQEASARDTISFNKNVQMQVLAPENAAYVVREAQVDGNAWSLLLLVHLGRGRLLLTGDCTRQAEERLAWPPADVLKVAHHGSAASTGPAMLAQARPGLAVISVGPNSYGHPAQQVLDNLAASGCQVYRTDQAGAVVLGFYKNKISCFCYTSN